jgi:hypothetical protein
MEGVTQVVLAVSAVLVAVVAGAGAAWKIWKAIDKVEDAWAVLSDIAEQFKPNGGQSLYDRITSLEHRVKQIQSDLEPFFTEGRSQT